MVAQPQMLIAREEVRSFLPLIATSDLFSQIAALDSNLPESNPLLLLDQHTNGRYFELQDAMRDDKLRTHGECCVLNTKRLQAVSFLLHQFCYVKDSHRFNVLDFSHVSC